MKRWLLVGSVALPFVMLAALVACFWVNVPVLDQWELVPLFQKYHEGSVGFADFFAQHNEHRLLFPRLVMFALAIPSHWDVRWEMAASLVFAAAAFAFLYLILRQTIASARLRWFAALSVSVIFFSPIQWENWLWGWQLQWYLNILGLIVAVWALSTWKAHPIWRIIVAAVGATLATYSLASGFFVWVVGVPLIWFVRPLRRWLWLWLLLAATAIGLHYVGYQDPANSPARSLFVHAPRAFVKYVAVYVGHPLTVQASHTAVIVLLYALGIGAALYGLWRRARQTLTTELLPWLVLGLYAGFAAASTGVSRLALGIGQAYASRYTALSQLLLIGFVVCLYVVLEQKKMQRRAKQLATIGLGLIGILVLLNVAKGVVQLREQSLYVQEGRVCALTAASNQDMCLLKLYPSPGVVWERLQYLRGIHWSGL